MKRSVLLLLLLAGCTSSEVSKPGVNRFYIPSSGPPMPPAISVNTLLLPKTNRMTMTNIVMTWTQNYDFIYNHPTNLIWVVHSNNSLVGKAYTNWATVATVTNMVYTNKNNFKVGSYFFYVVTSNTYTHLTSYP